MALCPSPDCSSERTLSPQLDNSTPNKKKTKLIVFESQELQDTIQSSSSSQRRKRTKSPGVRVVGGRIFDSENGKTCHQCRQKTMDFVVACKSPRVDKSCTMKFCHKCLLNRYGEKALDADQLDDWKCPKCRGICNCSHCMKKRGYQPTGSLLYTAKQTGFRTVLEMLTVNGPAKIVASLKKENSFDGKEESVLQPKFLTSASDGKNIGEYNWIKLEHVETDDSVFEGSKSGNVQLMRTKDDHCSTEISLSATNDGEEKIYGMINVCQEERKIRIKKWKELARAKRNAIVLERTKEDGGQHEKKLETVSCELAMSISTEKEEKKINETDDRNEEIAGNVHEGTKEDGAQVEMKSETFYHKATSISVEKEENVLNEKDDGDKRIVPSL